MNTIDEMMQAIEEHVGDCKIEVHKAAKLDNRQQIAVAVAFETMLDRIEELLREELLSEDELSGEDDAPGSE
jgi:phage-related minor tail protein